VATGALLCGGGAGLSGFAVATVFRGRRGGALDFDLTERQASYRGRVREFMDEHVRPRVADYHREQASGDRWKVIEVIEELKPKARAAGLWNLWRPKTHGGTLTNLEYAPLCEIMGRVGWAPEVFNCNAPDTGNMELLTMFADERQRKEWLEPLLAGEIRSAFCMTEPDVASSDATNIAARLERDGDEYVLSGRKIWSTGAMSKNCRLLVVMGVTNPDGEPHQRHSMLLVPRDTPGVRVVRSLHVFGFAEAGHGGHAEIIFDNVRVPSENLLGEENAGFALAQARLGPGRIHHCMRLVGMAERALELMCQRVVSRTAFGKPLADQGVVQQWIADARVWIEQVRLLVLKAAWLIDTQGTRGARIEISAIKVAAPAMASWVIDKAIQAHGGAGLSQDFPLAMLYSQARLLRLADGPDEVHQMAIARRELRPYRSTSG